MTDRKIEPGQKEQFSREALSLAPGAGARGPFSLENGTEYERWRDIKLAAMAVTTDDLVVEFKDTANPTRAEQEAIRDRIRRTGMALYVGPAFDSVADSKDQIRSLAGCFGLHRLDQNPYADEDAITPLHVAAGTERLEKGRKMYIPYTRRPINWHTDGYYNTPQRRIRAMVLHCVRQAGQSGGENALFDPEMVYVLMRERDPAMVAAFCADAAMTVPGNAVDDDVVRGDVSGPVFSLNRADGTLHMRYSARQRNMIWADDPDTRNAVAFMHEILSDNGPGEAYIYRHRMAPGQGLLCNNVLHTRAAFADGDGDREQRMMLRARFCDRVAGP